MANGIATLSTMPVAPISALSSRVNAATCRPPPIAASAPKIDQVPVAEAEPALAVADQRLGPRDGEVHPPAAERQADAGDGEQRGVDASTPPRRARRALSEATVPMMTSPSVMITSRP